MPTNVLRGSLPQVRWSAVVAGAVIALAAHVCLGLFGASLGYAAEARDSRGLGVLSALWALMVAFTSSLLGAMTATRLAAAAEHRSAWVHGALVWSLGLIAGAIFLSGTVAASAMGASFAWNGGIVASDGGRDMGPGAAIDSAAGEAALGSLLGGIAALFGLGGAIVGATIGRQSVAGVGIGEQKEIGIGRERDRDRDRERERERVQRGEPAYASTLMPPPVPERRDGNAADTVWSDPAFDRRRTTAEDRRRQH